MPPQPAISPVNKTDAPIPKRHWILRILIIFLCAIPILGGIFFFFLITGLNTPNGPQTVFTAQCGDGSTLALKVAVYKGNFELGDATGYGLFYESQNGSEVSLWDDGYSQTIQSIQRQFPSGGPSLYVGWRYDGKNITGPDGTDEFTPLPATTTGQDIFVYEHPTGTYDRNSAPWDNKLPLYMNIFLSSQAVSNENFSSIGSCLAANQQVLNAAMAKLPSYFPFRDKHYVYPLRLGGLVHGVPPFANPLYQMVVKNFWNESTSKTLSIPERGKLTLLPGQSAHGMIQGRDVTISVNASSTPNITINGKNFDDPFDSAHNNVPDPQDPGISLGANGVVIACTQGVGQCSTQVGMGGLNSDGSLSFIIWQCVKNGCQYQ